MSKYSIAFERFWKVYPTRQGESKMLAFKSWKKQKLDTEVNEIISALETLKKGQWRKDKDWYHPPMAATFLNQCRWETVTVESVAAHDLEKLRELPINQLTVEQKQALGWSHSLGSGWIPPT